jgi:hypothetical protein
VVVVAAVVVAVVVVVVAAAAAAAAVAVVMTMKATGSSGTSINFCQTVWCVRFPRDNNFRAHSLNLTVDHSVALVKMCDRIARKLLHTLN